jgi:hypothetical protein
MEVKEYVKLRVSCDRPGFFYLECDSPLHFPTTILTSYLNRSHPSPRIHILIFYTLRY